MENPNIAHFQDREAAIASFDAAVTAGPMR